MGMTDADCEDVLQLFARYSQTLDFGDVEGFVSCFTEDGSLDTSSPEEGVAGVHQGQSALRDFVSATLEYTAGRVRQSAVNPIIEGVVTTATA